jgi:hypothetical protein
MAALTAPRQTIARGTFYFEDEADVKANAVLYNGALCASDATGYLVAGAVSTALQRACVVECNGYGRVIDNTGGSNGAKRVKIKFGIFRFNNSSAGDLIAKANIGANCYIVDDNTVALTSGTSTRSVAGTIVDVDSSGVWVRLLP